MFLTRREKEDNYYRELQDRSLHRLQELSGRLWTDFNVHDPGVTITDYLNYGLYDLHYRFTFPFESYLNIGQSNTCQAKGLFSRQELYVQASLENRKEVARKSIVTEEDYEELILSAFSGRIEKCAVRLNQQALRYDLFIKVKDRDASHDVLQKVKRDIDRFYHRYRNIGETLGEIYFDWHLLEEGKLYKRKRYTKDVTYEFPEFEASPYRRPESVQPFSEEYHTIQYDFPENYGISARGIPRKEDPSYEAKVMQLKAFLLIFDTLMAEQLQLAKNTATLFDLHQAKPQRSLPDVAIVEGERIIDTEKKELADDETNSSNFYETQKFRYLNLLDTLYGEDTRTLFGKEKLTDLNGKRAEFIQKLPFLNEERFRSFDIYDLESTATIQKMADPILDLELAGYQMLSKHIKIIPDEEFFERYRFLLSPYIDRLEGYTKVEELPPGKADYEEKPFYKVLRLHFNLVWNGVLFESLLQYGTDLSNYKIMNYSNEYILMFFHPDKKIGINMSLFFSDKERLIELTYLFCDFIVKHNNATKVRSFYLVEHILLDFVPKEEYSRISIVLSDRSPVEKVEDLLRERLPAHLQINLYYLPDNLLKGFHPIYLGWRKALSESKSVYEYFAQIQSFLILNSSSKKQI